MESFFYDIMLYALQFFVLFLQEQNCVRKPETKLQLLTVKFQIFFYRFDAVCCHWQVV